MQPLYVDGDGVIRFASNEIVRFLLDWATPKGMSLNELALMRFSQDDRQQFAQLIGYSVSGAGDLSYMAREFIGQADRKAAKLARGPRYRLS